MNTAWRQRVLLFLAVSVFAFSILVISKQQRQGARPLDPAGGESFTNFVVIETPVYLQADPAWADDTIGGSDQPLSSAGSAVCCLSMAMHAFNVEATPKQLNSFLKQSGGYNFRGWLKWRAVTDFTGGRVRVDRAAPLKHSSIDTALRERNPVMAKLLIRGNTAEHWVLIVGKDGHEYLVRDPLGDGPSLEPLSKYESRVFAIRVIRKGGVR